MKIVVTQTPVSPSLLAAAPDTSATKVRVQPAIRGGLHCAYSQFQRQKMNGTGRKQIHP